MLRAVSVILLFLIVLFASSTVSASNCSSRLNCSRTQNFTRTATFTQSLTTSGEKSPSDNETESKSDPSPSLTITLSPSPASSSQTDNRTVSPSFSGNISETASNPTSTDDTAESITRSSVSGIATVSDNSTLSHECSLSGSLPTDTMSENRTNTTSRTNTVSLPYKAPHRQPLSREIFPGVGAAVFFLTISGQERLGAGGFFLVRKLIASAEMSECNVLVQRRSSIHYRNEYDMSDPPHITSDANPIFAAYDLSPPAPPKRTLLEQLEFDNLSERFNHNLTATGSDLLFNETLEDEDEEKRDLDSMERYIGSVLFLSLVFFGWLLCALTIASTVFFAPGRSLTMNLRASRLLGWIGFFILIYGTALAQPMGLMMFVRKSNKHYGRGVVAGGAIAFILYLGAALALYCYLYFKLSFRRVVADLDPEKAAQLRAERMLFAVEEMYDSSGNKKDPPEGMDTRIDAEAPSCCFADDGNRRGCCGCLFSSLCCWFCCSCSSSKGGSATSLVDKKALHDLRIVRSTEPEALMKVNLKRRRETKVDVFIQRRTVISKELELLEQEQDGRGRVEQEEIAKRQVVVEILERVETTIRKKKKHGGKKAKKSRRDNENSPASPSAAAAASSAAKVSAPADLNEPLLAAVALEEEEERRLATQCNNDGGPRDVAASTADKKLSTSPSLNVQTLSTEEVEAKEVAALSRSGRFVLLLQATWRFCMHRKNIWRPTQTVQLFGPMFDLFGPSLLFPFVDFMVAFFSSAVTGATIEYCTSDACCRAGSFFSVFFALIHTGVVFVGSGFGPLSRFTKYSNIAATLISLISTGLSFGVSMVEPLSRQALQLEVALVAIVYVSQVVALAALVVFFVAAMLALKARTSKVRDEVAQEVEEELQSRGRLGDLEEKSSGEDDDDDEDDGSLLMPAVPARKPRPKFKRYLNRRVQFLDDDEQEDQQPHAPLPPQYSFLEDSDESDDESKVLVFRGRPHPRSASPSPAPVPSAAAAARYSPSSLQHSQRNHHGHDDDGGDDGTAPGNSVVPIDQRMVKPRSEKQILRFEQLQKRLYESADVPEQLTCVAPDAYADEVIDDDEEDVGDAAAAAEEEEEEEVEDHQYFYSPEDFLPAAGDQEEGEEAEEFPNDADADDDGEIEMEELDDAEFERLTGLSRRM